MDLTIKGHKENFLNDGTILYLDCSMTYALVKTCRTTHFWFSLFVNYTLIFKVCWGEYKLVIIDLKFPQHALLPCIRLNRTVCINSSQVHLKSINNQGLDTRIILLFEDTFDQVALYN